MAPLTEIERLDVLADWAQTQDCTKTARNKQVGRATVSRLVNNYKKGLGISMKRKSGRRPVVSQDAARAALDILTNTEASATATDAAKELFSRGLVSKVVSKSTVIRHAKHAAVKEGSKLWVHRGKPEKELTQRTKVQRLAFAQDNISTSWSNAMFTDRKRFYFNFPGSVARMVRWRMGPKRRLTRPRAFQPNRPMCVNCYGGITKHGLSRLVMVAGTSKLKSPYTTVKGQQAKNITMHEYKSHVLPQLLACGKRIFSTVGMGTWKLVQDNDPAHNNSVATVDSWAHAHSSGVSVVPNWPPHSPDLNLIENVWAWIQAKINQKGCKTFQAFQQQLANVWASIPQSMIHNLYKSMPKRINQVMSNNGDKTKY